MSFQGYLAWVPRKPSTYFWASGSFPPRLLLALAGLGLSPGSRGTLFLREYWWGPRHFWNHQVCAPIRCYHSRRECTWEQWQWRGTLYSPKFQHHWNLTIRFPYCIHFWTNTLWKSINSQYDTPNECHISRTLTGRRVLTPLQRCSRCILQLQPTGLWNLGVTERWNKY